METHSIKVMEWLMYAFKCQNEGPLVGLLKHPLMDEHNIVHFIRRMTGNPMPVMGIPTLMRTIVVRDVWNNDGKHWGKYVHCTIGITTYAARVYIADRSCIRVLDNRTGQLKETWTSKLKMPNGMCWYRAELYVVDTYRHCISVFDHSGTNVREWTVHLSASITAIAVNDDGVFVSDKVRRCIFVYSTCGELRSCWEETPTRPLRVPLGLASNNGELFIADNYTHQIHVLDSRNGDYKRSWGGFGVLKNPRSIAVCLDVVFVTDKGHRQVQAFESNGRFLWEWGQFGEEGNTFTLPSGICTDGQRLFVTDCLHSRVTVLSSVK